MLCVAPAAILTCSRVAPYVQGQYDVNIPRLFVLLHDACDESVDPLRIFRRMRSTFPAADCFLLQINSLPEVSPNLEQRDVWERYIERPLFSNPAPVTAVRGCLLAPADLDTIRRFASKLIKDAIVPHLERRMFALHSTISQNRKVRDPTCGTVQLRVAMTLTCVCSSLCRVCGTLSSRGGASRRTRLLSALPRRAVGSQ